MLTIAFSGLLRCKTRTTCDLGQINGALHNGCGAVGADLGGCEDQSPVLARGLGLKWPGRRVGAGVWGSFAGLQAMALRSSRALASRLWAACRWCSAWARDLAPLHRTVGAVPGKYAPGSAPAGRHLASPGESRAIPEKPSFIASGSTTEW